MDYKAEQFFNAAIEKTKSSRLGWSRISRLELPWFEGVDRERSFSASFGAGTIFLVRSSKSGSISCIIKAAEELRHQQLGESDDATLLRLYNIVYSLFPSVESFIDAFIDGSPTE